MVLPLADDWPSYAEELGRKTTEVIDKWVKARSAGRISNRELFILVSGLNDATSGLVPRDVSDLLAALHEECRHGRT